MSSVIQRLLKRNAYPVAIGSETVHVRPLTLGEAAFIDEVDGTEKVGWVIGNALVNDAGEPEFKRSEGESNAAFARRVGDAISEIPQDTLAAISAGIEKASRVPSTESLKKS